MDDRTGRKRTLEHDLCDSADDRADAMMKAIKSKLA
jgi:hypothetical protein